MRKTPLFSSIPSFSQRFSQAFADSNAPKASFVHLYRDSQQLCSFLLVSEDSTRDQLNRLKHRTSLIVVSVAHVSAEAWQWAACIRDDDGVSSDELLDLICCFPFHQLGRLALFLWTFFCFSPPQHDYYYYDDDDDDDD